MGLGLKFPALNLSAAEREKPGVSIADSNRTAIAVEALSRLQGVDINQNPKLKEAVLKVLAATRGTPQFVKIVRQFHLTDQTAGLLELAIQNPASDGGVEAMRLILANNDLTLVQQTLQGTNASAAHNTAEVLGNTCENAAARLLLPVATDARCSRELRKQAVRSLAQTWEGATALIQLEKEERLANDLRLTASAELNRARWPEIKAEAVRILPLSHGQNDQPLPPLAELLKMKGDPANGAKLFFEPAAGCANCHQVKGQGTDFGPNLSEIGSKLAKEALYEAILNPSAGISFGYEAWQLQLKSGDEAYGLIVSETAAEVAMKDAKGIITRYPKSKIQQREQMKLSIMPADLQQTMTAQQLVDLVEFLSSLKGAVSN